MHRWPFQNAQISTKFFRYNHNPERKKLLIEKFCSHSQRVQWAQQRQQRRRWRRWRAKQHSSTQKIYVSRAMRERAYSQLLVSTWLARCCIYIEWNKTKWFAVALCMAFVSSDTVFRSQTLPKPHKPCIFTVQLNRVSTVALGSHSIFQLSIPVSF